MLGLTSGLAMSSASALPTQLPLIWFSPTLLTSLKTLASLYFPYSFGLISSTASFYSPYVDVVATFSESPYH